MTLPFQEKAPEQSGTISRAAAAIRRGVMPPCAGLAQDSSGASEVFNVKNETWKSDSSVSDRNPAGRLFDPHTLLFRTARSKRKPVTGSRARNQRDSSDPDRRCEPVEVICAGMYRACSTWQYEVVAHLIEQYCDGERLGYLTSDEYTALRRSDRANPHSIARPRWRVFKSHDADRVFESAVREGRARVVYAYRDVRDVIFSLMHKRGLTFEQLMRQGMIHQVLANDRFWMAQPDSLVQRYDDLIAEPANGVIGLARFLGIAIEQGEAVRIAEMYSQEANRARTQALRDRLQQSGLDLESAANAQICDPKTLLHWNHMRPGGAGSWITKAQPRHRVVLKRMCQGWLRSRQYEVEPRKTTDIARSPVSVRDLIQIELDMLVARINFLVQSASRRYPGLARNVKPLLGLGATARAGATVWADSSSISRTVTEPGTTRWIDPGVDGLPRATGHRSLGRSLDQ